MDWFEKLTGFPESTYEETRQKLEVRNGRLISRVNGRSYRVGKLELLSLATLRSKTAEIPIEGRFSVRNVSGDVRGLHHDPANRGSLFQVASQFNLLEMTSFSVTPEDGVTRYAHDPTKGGQHAPSQPVPAQSTETTSRPWANKWGRPPDASLTPHPSCAPPLLRLLAWSRKSSGLPKTAMPSPPLKGFEQRQMS